MELAYILSYRPHNPVDQVTSGSTPCAATSENGVEVVVCDDSAVNDDANLPVDDRIDTLPDTTTSNDNERAGATPVSADTSNGQLPVYVVDEPHTAHVSVEGLVTDIGASGVVEIGSELGSNHQAVPGSSEQFDCVPQQQLTPTLPDADQGIAEVENDHGGGAGQYGRQLCCGCSCRYKSPCAHCCLQCLLVATSLRFVFMTIGLVGAGSLVIGIVFGALNMVTGNSYLTVSLIFIAIGVIAIVVVGVAWRCVPNDGEPCHRCLHLSGTSGMSDGERGDNYRQRYRDSSRGFRFNQGNRNHRNQWHGGMIYQEFHYEVPPPTYDQSLSHRPLPPPRSRSRQSRGNDGRQSAGLDEDGGNHTQFVDGVSLPAAVPSSSTAAINSDSWSIADELSLPNSRPPSYRSRAGSSRRFRSTYQQRSSVLPVPVADSSDGSMPPEPSPAPPEYEQCVAVAANEIQNSTTSVEVVQTQAFTDSSVTYDDEDAVRGLSTTPSVATDLPIDANINAIDVKSLSQHQPDCKIGESVVTADTSRDQAGVQSDSTSLSFDNEEQTVIDASSAVVSAAVDPPGSEVKTKWDCAPGRFELRRSRSQTFGEPSSADETSNEEATKITTASSVRDLVQRIEHGTSDSAAVTSSAISSTRDGVGAVPVVSLSRRSPADIENSSSDNMRL